MQYNYNTFLEKTQENLDQNHSKKENNFHSSNQLNTESETIKKETEIKKILIHPKNLFGKLNIDFKVFLYNYSKIKNSSIRVFLKIYNQCIIDWNKAKRNFAKIRQKKMAEKLEISLSTVIRCVKLLEKQGFIHVERGNKDINHYYVTNKIFLDYECYLNDTSMTLTKGVIFDCNLHKNEVVTESTSEITKLNINLKQDINNNNNTREIYKEQKKCQIKNPVVVSDEIVKKLELIGITDTSFFDDSYSILEIQNYIDYTLKKAKKNRAGFFRRALEEKWDISQSEVIPQEKERFNLLKNNFHTFKKENPERYKKILIQIFRKQKRSYDNESDRFEFYKELENSANLERFMKAVIKKGEMQT